MILALVGAQLTSLTVAREWERGTMEQLISTPVTPIEVMLGKLWPYFVIGLLDAAFCLGSAAFWFQVPFRGTWVTPVLTHRVLLAVVLGIGYLVSVVTEASSAPPDRADGDHAAGDVAVRLHLPDRSDAGSVAGSHLLVYARYYVTILSAVFLKGLGRRPSLCRSLPDGLCGHCHFPRRACIPQSVGLARCSTALPRHDQGTDRAAP